MKKFFVFFILTVLVMSTALSGCSSSEADRDEELKDSLESTYEELTATFSSDNGEYSLVAEYLRSWSSKNDISIAADEDSYMIFKNPATEGCENVASTTLQCTLDTGSLSSSIQTLAISLTCLLGPLEHGDISLILTETEDGQYTGASAIDPKYLKCDNFINMQHSDEVQLYTSGAYTASASMTADITTDEPSYSHAYAITMKTSGYHNLFTTDGNTYPNPVEVIGNLLATEKSSGQLFEVASFECESTAGYIPNSATAVVVIDTNDVSSFEKKFRSSYNNMKKKFEKLEDNFVYTFTETAMPASVMSSTTCDIIISLMYTLKTGDFVGDEETDETIALSEISGVTTSGGTFRLSTAFRSTDEAVIDEMGEVFLTTSSLCDIDYSQSDTSITWPSQENKKQANFFIDALGAEETVFTSELDSDEVDIFASKGQLNIISYRCNIHHGEAALTNICNYFLNLTAK